MRIDGLYSPIDPLTLAIVEKFLPSGWPFLHNHGHRLPIAGLFFPIAGLFFPIAGLFSPSPGFFSPSLDFFSPSPGFFC